MTVRGAGGCVREGNQDVTQRFLVRAHARVDELEELGLEQREDTAQTTRGADGQGERRAHAEQQLELAPGELRLEVPEELLARLHGRVRCLRVQTEMR